MEEKCRTKQQTAGCRREERIHAKLPSYLIYTSDGWRLRNPFAGSGGVGRLFLQNIMIRKSSPRWGIAEGTATMVRETEKLWIYKHRTCASVPHRQHPMALPCSMGTPGNFGEVQLRVGKAHSLICDNIAPWSPLSAAELQEVDNSKC